MLKNAPLDGLRDTYPTLLKYWLSFFYYKDFKSDSCWVTQKFYSVFIVS